MDADLVVLRTFGNRFEADVAKSALDAVEIDSLIRADDGGGMQLGMWTGTGVDLLVRAEDAPRALEILDTRAIPKPEERH